MSYIPMYCEATHPTSPNGCYEPYGHAGTKHRGYLIPCDGGEEFYWDDAAPEVPAGSAAVVLTENEIAVVLASLVGLETVIPGLAKPIIEKLNAAREAVLK